MNFKQYLEESEKFLSATFHTEDRDPHETKLRSAMENFVEANEFLDDCKKNKYYGRPCKLDHGRIQSRLEPFEFDEGDRSEKLLHGIIGIATEAGELVETMISSKWEGKTLDKVNIKEELGDIYWYMAILHRELGLTQEEVFQQNINKLTLRNGGKKFSADKVINRDIDKERKFLEESE